MGLTSVKGSTSKMGSTSEIQNVLRQESRSGPIPFVRFMETALYHPEHGYYMTERPRLGRQGDFVTAPEMTSLFGEMLTIQWIQLWQLMGQPNTFTVVEGGAGSGKLAQDILTTADHFSPFAQALNYRIIERSPSFRVEQQKALKKWSAEGKVAWHETLQSLGEHDTGKIEGVIFSNELLDAMPVHWVEMTSGSGGSGGRGVLKEVAVAWNDAEEAWRETLITPKAPLSADYFDRAGDEEPVPPVGGRAEVGLQAQRWIENAAALLKQGMIVTIDYGATARELYGAFSEAGTVMGHYRHETISNPLLHIGEMDLTSHVNFTDLARSGERAGLTNLGYTTQSWFLMGLGILQRVESALAKLQEDKTAASNLTQTVQRLVMPGGMGERFKVVAQGRGLNADIQAQLAGFHMKNSLKQLLASSP